MKKRTASGNVFRNLRFGQGKAANFKVRAMLMAELEKHIRSKHMTHQQAAERIGVTRPRISDLMRGQIARFSVDALINMLTNAGLKVDVRVRRSAAA